MLKQKGLKETGVVFLISKERWKKHNFFICQNGLKEISEILPESWSSYVQHGKWLRYVTNEYNFLVLCCEELHIVRRELFPSFKLRERSNLKWVLTFDIKKYRRHYLSLSIELQTQASGVVFQYINIFRCWNYSALIRN